MLVLQLLSFSACVLSASANNVFESLHQVPRGWSYVRAAKGSESIKLRLSLKQQNLDSFYDKLMEVSTPDHAQYGKHYQGHELRSLLQPSEEASSSAISWLQDHNVTAIQDDGEYVLFSTDVKTANQMLDTEFSWYRSEENQMVLRTMRYSIPEGVKDHVNFVQPTTRFGSLKPLSSTAQVIEVGAKAESSSPKWWGGSSPQVNVTCNLTITPECIFELYNVHYGADADNGNTVGYASFLEEYARYTDLAKFESLYAPYAAGENVGNP
jgi:tripeptidyl-peptidase-1